MASASIEEVIGLPSDLKIVTGTNGHSRKLCFLVTGGCGYFGFHLAKSLHALGAHVRIMDVQLPPQIKKHLDKRLTFMKGDIRSYSSVVDAVHGIDQVFHTASFGLSGADQLISGRTHEVNVGGTKNIIRACIEGGVERLVYTSSYNVVLSMNPIEMGDESLPYATPDSLVDYYSISKLEADQLVLAANGTAISGGGVLKTCCLRPSGIYGPGEKRHMERIVFYIEAGVMLMKPGDAVCDWVHVNNLVQAHLLTIPALSSACNNIAAGEAYFVSDDRPMKLFTFLRPLFHALHQEVPRLTCPFFILYFIAFLVEWVFHMVGKSLCKFHPFLTRGEVIKMCINHFHTMKKARKQLGYSPKSYDFADVVAIYLQDKSLCSTGESSQGKVLLRYWKIWILILLFFSPLLLILN